MKGFKKLGHANLAEGETVGHFHAAIGESVSLWGNDAGLMVLDAPKGCEVTHQEHRPVAIPPGKYDRHIVQEWDHFAEEARDVRD